MTKYDVLWTQRANARANTLAHLGNFIYEFIGGRLTYLAFIALFNFSAIGFGVFDKVLTFSIAIFLYYLISDTFNVFWTGINLKYSITEQGISYNWGVFKNHELNIRFEEITSFAVIQNGKRKAIEFLNINNVKNGDFGFSKELHFNQLTFENINDLQKVIQILQSNTDLILEEGETAKSNKIDNKLTNSNVYLKFLQLISLTFLYLASSICLHLIDNNLLPSTSVVDKVVAQKTNSYNSKSHFCDLITLKDHSFAIRVTYMEDYVGEEVELLVSPIFKNVVEIKKIKYQDYLSLENGYHGPVKIMVKLVALFLSLCSAIYIFYKRSIVPFEDLSILLLFPAIFLFLAYYFFH